MPKSHLIEKFMKQIIIKIYFEGVAKKFDLKNGLNLVEFMTIVISQEQ